MTDAVLLGSRAGTHQPIQPLAGVPGAEAATIARQVATKLAAPGVALIGCLRADFARTVISGQSALIGIDVPARVREMELAHPGQDLHEVSPQTWPDGLEATVAGMVALISLEWVAEPTFRRRLTTIVSAAPVVLVADPDGTAGLEAMPRLLEMLEGCGLEIVHRSLVRPPGRSGRARESPFVALRGTAGSALDDLLGAGARGLALDPLVDSSVRLDRPPRICVASYEVVGPTHNGGIGTANTSLAQALARAGHDVTLLFTGPENAIEPLVRSRCAHRYARDDIRFEVLEAPAHPIHVPHYNARRSYELFRWLLRESRERPFDVVHFPECQGHGYYPVLAKRAGTAFANTTFVAGVHSSTRWCAEANDELPRTLDFLVDENLERRSVELADVLISPSAYMIDYMLERGWALPERRFVQQYVVPPTARRRPGVPARTRQSPPRELVFFGRLEVRKGLHTFCDAVDELADELPDDLRITFLGRLEHIAGEPSADYVRRRAARWSCPVELLGELPQADALAYLRRHNCVAVMPSTVDNSPNTVTETVSLGIPVLASRSGGTGELLDPLALARHTFPGIVPRTGVAPAPADTPAGDVSAAALAARIRDLLAVPADAPAFAIDHDRGERSHVGWNAGAAAAARQAVPAQEADASALPSTTVGVLHRDDPEGLMHTLCSLTEEAGRDTPVVAVDLASQSSDTQDRLVWAKEICQAHEWELERLVTADGAAACHLIAARTNSELLIVLRAGEELLPGSLERIREIAARCSADIVTWAAQRSTPDQALAQNGEPPATAVPIDGPPIAGLFYPAFTVGGFAMRRGMLDQLHAPPDIRGNEALQVLVNEALVSGANLILVPDELTRLRTPDSWSSMRSAFAVQYGPSPQSRSEELRVARTYRRAPDALADAAALLLAASRGSAPGSVLISAEYKALDVRRHEQAEYIAYLEAEHHKLSSEIHRLRRRVADRVLARAGRGLRAALSTGRR